MVTTRGPPSTSRVQGILRLGRPRKPSSSSYSRVACSTVTIRGRSSSASSRTAAVAAAVTAQFTARVRHREEALPALPEVALTGMANPRDMFPALAPIPLRMGPASSRLPDRYEVVDDEPDPRGGELPENDPDEEGPRGHVQLHPAISVGVLADCYGW